MAKKRNNYFSDNIQRNGEGFLQQYDARKLRNDANRVFKDIAYGNIDFDKYWAYFTEPTFINALIDVADTKYRIHQYSYESLFNTTMMRTTNDLEIIKRYHKRLAEAYRLFYDYFVGVKMSGYSGEAISNLKALSSRTREYAPDMNDPVFGANIGSDQNTYTHNDGRSVTRFDKVPTVTMDPLPEPSHEEVQLSFNSLIKNGPDKGQKEVKPIWTRQP
jgi:hypothetical protein